jgi:hypothetical protein
LEFETLVNATRFFAAIAGSPGAVIMLAEQARRPSPRDCGAGESMPVN